MWCDEGNVIIRLYLADVFTTAMKEKLRAARRVVETQWRMPEAELKIDHS